LAVKEEDLDKQVVFLLLFSTIEVSSQNLTQQQYLEDLAFFITELPKMSLIKLITRFSNPLTSQ